MKEIELFFMSYIGAAILILSGVALLRFIKISPESKASPFGRDIKGNIAGIWFILMGIIVIGAKILGKL